VCKRSSRVRVDHGERKRNRVLGYERQSYFPVSKADRCYYQRIKQLQHPFEIIVIEIVIIIGTIRVIPVTKRDIGIEKSNAMIQMKVMKMTMKGMMNSTRILININNN